MTTDKFLRTPQPASSSQPDLEAAPTAGEQSEDAPDESPPEVERIVEAAQPEASPEAEPDIERIVEAASTEASTEPEPSAVEPDVEQIVDAVQPEPPPEAESLASPTTGESVEIPASAPATVAGHIAASLHAAGVKFAFTVPGESFLPLLEAFGDVGIRVVATRHENGAGFMAEAYGQLTGRPAACLGTRAVGAANLAIGIHTARADSTPMFALVGQVERGFRGREAFQEIDQPASVGRLAKWAGEIDEPGAAAGVIADAVRHALSGRPGPVLVSVPEDVLDAELPATELVTPRATVGRVGFRGRSIGHPAAGIRPPTRHPGGCRCPALTCLEGPRSASPSCSTSRSWPPGGGATSSPTTIRCTWA